MTEAATQTGIRGREVGQHIAALDGVRAAAICAVVALHIAYDRFSGGFLGVDVFFVLSAFLITTLVLEETSQRDGAYSFRNFYIRRALRLGPALVIWLVLIAPVCAAALGQRRLIGTSTAIVLLYLTDFNEALGTQGLSGAYGHGWSLAVEEQFYLLWPALLVLATRRLRISTRRRLLEAGVIGGVAALTIGDALLHGRNYFLPTGHLVSLAVGSLAADYVAVGLPGYVETISRQWATPVAATAAVGALVVGYNILHQPMAVGTTLTAIGTALVILHVVIRNDGFTARALAHPVSVWLGRRSYGVYLYQLSLLGLLPALFPGMRLRVFGPLSLLIGIAAVAVSFRFAESPIQTWGRRRWLTGENS